MTTVATDGKTMAADTLACIGDRVSHNDVVKMFVLRDGRIVGLCNKTGCWQAIIDYLNGDRDDLPFEGGEAAGLVLSRNGTAMIIDSDGETWPVMVPHAIGSGSDFAIGAMEAGVNTAQAVVIASKRDVGTGGLKINVMSCPEPVEQPKQSLLRKRKWSDGWR